MNPRAAKRSDVAGHPTILWALCLLAIVVSSFVPKDMIGGPALPAGWSSLAHILAYALSTILTIQMFTARFPLWRIWAAGVVASLIGITIEALQPLFDRQMSFLDIFYNELGVVVAFGLWFTIRHYRSRATRSFPTSKG